MRRLTIARAAEGLSQAQEVSEIKHLNNNEIVIQRQFVSEMKQAERKSLFRQLI